MSGSGRHTEREPVRHRTPTGSVELTVPESDTHSEPAAGPAERLESSFAQAAAVADRAVGLWLARHSDVPSPHAVAQETGDGFGENLRALRALVRAAATAYARQLRADGVPPERMLVLVKTATAHHGSPGFGAQELTNDIVRWSIEAYFDE